MRHKLVRDSQIKTGHLHSTRRPNRVIIEKKSKKRGTCRHVDFAIPAGHRVKLKENEKGDKYADISKELKETMELEGECFSSCNCCTGNNPHSLGRRTGRVKNQRKRRDHPDYSISYISQNIEKSSGDLRGIAVTKTPVKYPSANSNVENSQRSKISLILLTMTIIILKILGV